MVQTSTLNLSIQQFTLGTWNYYNFWKSLIIGKYYSNLRAKMVIFAKKWSNYQKRFRREKRSSVRIAMRDFRLGDNYSQSLELSNEDVEFEA